MSVGKAAYLAKHGADGIIDISPFSCMNGIVSEAIYPKLSKDYGGIPIRNFYFDGTQSDLDRDLGIYLELARSYHETKSTYAIYPAYFTPAAQRPVKLTTGVKMYPLPPSKGSGALRRLHGCPCFSRGPLQPAAVSLAGGLLGFVGHSVCFRGDKKIRPVGAPGLPTALGTLANHWRRRALTPCFPDTPNFFTASKGRGRREEEGGDVSVPI